MRHGRRHTGRTGRAAGIPATSRPRGGWCCVVRSRQAGAAAACSRLRDAGGVRPAGGGGVCRHKGGGSRRRHHRNYLHCRRVVRARGRFQVGAAAYPRATGGTRGVPGGIAYPISWIVKLRRPAQKAGTKRSVTLAAPVADHAWPPADARLRPAGISATGHFRPDRFQVTGIS